MRLRDRNRLFSLLVLAMASLSAMLLLSWPTAAQAVTAQHYTELEFPPLDEIQIPDYERYELDNGLIVYLMEDHELPLISGSATFRTGDYLVSEAQVGLSGITGEAMRLGGTEAYPPDQLSQLLEQRAASVETGFDTTSGNASFNTLSEDLDDVFALFADVVRRPAFAPDQVELVKSQFRGGIARRNDNPDDVTTREFKQLIYGQASPYARTVEYASLDNISRDDVVDFYQSTIRPEGTILGIVGDFDPAQMKALIAEAFGDWQGQGQLAMSKPPEASQKQTGVFAVDQPQLTQSYIHIGHIGGELRNPYHAPMVVLNEVLNGFGGRLFNEIRSRQGLAYSVYAFWSPRYDYPGMFIGGGQTRSEATVPFIQAMLKQIEQIRQEPISEAELQYAKDAVINGFVFNFDTPDDTLSRLIRYEYYGYPSDFVFQFQADVESATIEQVLKAAQTNLKPEQLVTIVVGNLAAIQPALDTLGEGIVVTPVDIAIPPPSS